MVRNVITQQDYEGAGNFFSEKRVKFNEFEINIEKMSQIKKWRRVKCDKLTI